MNHGWKDVSWVGHPVDLLICLVWVPVGTAGDYNLTLARQLTPCDGVKMKRWVFK